MSSSSKKYSVALENMEEVESVFKRFDANGDGKITSTELADVCKALGSETSPEELKHMMDEIDTDGDGFIDLQEFDDFHRGGSTVNGTNVADGIRELKDAFEMYDEDKNGLISGGELHMVLKSLGETCTTLKHSFDADVGRIGIGICHDLRFPELAMLYRERGADLICYPATFNMSTGNLLWELVQRARAVDNQLFVATCSPARDSSGSYMIWGHSTLVGSFGEVIATSGHEETNVIAEIDYSMSQLRRENLPLEKQKRGDIYQLIDCTNDLPVMRTRS